MNEIKKYYDLQKTSKKKYESFLKKLSSHTTSHDCFTVKDDLFEKTRKELHNKIINGYLVQHRCQSKPQVHFILGSIGSGKTSLKDTVVKNEKNKRFIYINFDDLKLRLPEYKLLKKLNPKKASHFVHLESAKLALALYQKAIKNKTNIIYERNIRLNKKGGIYIISEIKDALRKGYNMSIHVVFLDSWQEAWKRVKSRYEEIRRYIPREDIKNTFKSLFPNLNVLMNENFNAEYTVKLWYNGKKREDPSLGKEIQAIGIVSFKKKRYIKVSCKKEDIKVVFEGITSNKIPYMGAIFNMKGVSKQARNSLKCLDCFKNAIDNME